MWENEHENNKPVERQLLKAWEHFLIRHLMLSDFRKKPWEQKWKHRYLGGHNVQNVPPMPRALQEDLTIAKEILVLPNVI